MSSSATSTTTDENQDNSRVTLARAIISVSDKTGLTEFATRLTELGVEIFSTGGTRRHLEDAGLAVQDVSAYTGFPEMMDGRLKTLHPKVFGGILARQDRPDDMQSLADESIHTFELVVVNLYPFEQTAARPGVSDAEAIEQIDIGGPSLVRAAAKNHRFTTILTSPGQYDSLMRELTDQGTTSLALRRNFAKTAFESTASYDRAIADYFARPAGKSTGSQENTDPSCADFPDQLSQTWQRQAVLRYGENPHQQAALYAGNDSSGSLVQAQQLNGKELSYNNWLDLDAAWGIAISFQKPCVVVIKHNNPCGVACSDSISAATVAAMAGDPVSAFGSVLGFNQPVDEAAAEVLVQPGLFVEAIVAPSFTPDAIEKLTTVPKWKKNVRLMEIGTMAPASGGQAIREINGGVLVQAADVVATDTGAWDFVTDVKPDSSLIEQLHFAWDVVRHVRSNAIAVCGESSAYGIGAGQMSRVDAVDIAIAKAGDRARGAVLSSDAFFPFPDSIRKAAAAGITTIVQPGGSRKDDEVTAACNELGLCMAHTARRHFKH